MDCFPPRCARGRNDDGSIYPVNSSYCSRVARVKPEMGVFCACREGIPVKKPELTEQRRKIRPFPARHEL